MKILIVDNASMTLKNGIVATNSMNGLFVCDLISQGNEVHYFQFLISNPRSINDFDLTRSGVHCILLKYHKNIYIRYIVAIMRFVKILNKYDFVYIYSPSSFIILTYICALFGKKYGLYIRGEQLLKNIFYEICYKKANIILTVSEVFTHYVRTICKKGKISTIRPMIQYGYCDIITDRQYFQKSVYTVLFLSRISKEKGIVELLTALSVLKKGNKYAFKVLIVGDGDFFNQANLVSEKLGIGDVVEFLGAVTDIEKKKYLYMNADVYILPTYSEGFPRTIYESMIFGVPIITTFVGGISSIMCNNHNCIQIAPHSIDSIKNAIEYVFNNYEMVGKFAREATSNIKSILDPQKLSHGDMLNYLLNYDTK